MKKIHKIVAFVVLFVFVAQIFTKFSIILDYYINKDYIAKNLCENKKKPQMHCNGKCHLMKQLKKQEKKETPAPSSQSKEKFEVPYCGVAYAVQIPIIAQNLPSIKHNFHYINQPITRFQGSIFHPPQNNG